MNSAFYFSFVHEPLRPLLAAVAGCGANKSKKQTLLCRLCIKIRVFFLNSRFCKDIFDRDYKATIGVDFEIERFEIAGVPYTLQV